MDKKTIDPYREELARVASFLPETDPRTDGYSTLLRNIEGLVKVASAAPTREELSLVWAGKETPEAEKEEGRKEPEKAEEKAAPEGLPWEEDSPYPDATAPDTNNITPTPTESLTKESVRDFLRQAAQSGVRIQSILTKFVPEGKALKFSSVPPESYGELVAALNYEMKG